MEEEQLSKEQQIWDKLKGIGKFGLDLLKGLGQGLARAGGEIALWSLDLFRKGKEFITTGKIAPSQPLTIIPETPTEKFFYGEEPLKAKDPLNVLLDFTIRPITRRLYSGYLSLQKVQEPVEPKSFIAKTLLGEEPVIPLVEEAKLYGKLSEKYLGEGEVWKVPGYFMFAGVVALDLWIPGKGRVKVPLSKEALKELAKTTEKETIEQILKENIVEFHHPKLYNKVGEIAEKLVEKNTPKEVYKTLQGEFRRLGKELGFDIKRDLKKEGIGPAIDIEKLEIPKGFEPLARQALQYENVDDFLKKSLKFFHSVTTQDLDLIKEKGNKIIAPSFGIAKDINVIKKYGDVTFLVPEDILKKTPIYERDIYSITLRELPSNLYLPNQSNIKKLKAILSDLGINLRKEVGASLNSAIRESLTYDDAINHITRFYLYNSESFYDYQGEIAKRLGIKYTQEELEEGIVIEKIANALFQKIEPTPENISKWLKTVYKERRGAGFGAGITGTAFAARRVSYERLYQAASKITEKYDETLWETIMKKQSEAIREVRTLLDSMIIDEEFAAILARQPNLTSFKKRLVEEGIKIDTIPSKNIERAYKKLREAFIDIPTDYFEAKSYDVFDINDFPAVITNNEAAIQKLKEMNYQGKIYRSFADFYKEVREKAERIKPEIPGEIPPKPPKNPPLDNIPFEFDFNPKGKDFKVRSVFKNLWREKPEMMQDLSKMIDDGAIFYEPLSNKELVAQAIKEMEGLTVEELERQISHFRPFTPKTLAEEGKMAKMNVKILALAEYYRSMGQIDKAREVIEKLIKAGTELGRAVQSFRPIYKSHPLVKEIWAPRAFIKRIQEMAEVQGKKISEDLLHEWELKAKEIFRMENPPDIQERMFGEFIEKEIIPHLPMTLTDKFELIRYGNMLSGPLSYLRNLTGNVAQLLARNIFIVPTKLLIDYIKNPAMGRFNDVVVAPIKQQWKETIAHIPIAWEYAVKTFKEGGPPSEKFIGALADSDTFEALIRYYQYKNLKMPLKIWTMPLNALEATDKFFSTLIAAGEKARLTAEYEARGIKITARVKREIEEQAQELAERYLFRRPLGYKREDLNAFSQALDAIGTTMLNARRRLLRGATWGEKALGILLGFLEPFVRTPINIGIEMFEMSPAGFLRRPSTMTSEKLAKATVGTIFTGFAAIKAFQGATTWLPPKDERERMLFYEHRKPMSINIVGIDVPFLYFGSLGVALAAPAAIQWVLLEKKPEFDSELLDAITKSAIEINRFIMSQTSLSGLMNFAKVLTGEDFWKPGGYIGYTATQMLPLSGFLRWVARLTDPVYRKVGEDFWGPIKDNLPFIRKSLEAYENLTGEARMRASDLFLPYGVRAGVKLPLTLALQEVQIDRLRRKAYDAYMRKAMSMEDIGNYVKMLEGRKVELTEKDIKEGLKILEMLKTKTYDRPEEKRAAAYFMASFIPELYKHLPEEEINRILADIPEDLHDMAYEIALRRKELRETPIQIPEAIKEWSAEKRAEFLLTYLEEMGKILEGEVFDALIEELRDRGIMTEKVEEYMWAKLKEAGKIKE